MDSICAKVNSDSFIGKNYPGDDQHMQKLIADTTQSCVRYGAYKVRIAAIEQQKGKDVLADVGLAAYKANYEDHLHISNIAFHSMTDEEVHIEFCANNHLTPWLFL